MALAQIIIRNDTSAMWELFNPVLAKGELAVTTDLVPAQVKIGDGVSNWMSLPYQGSVVSAHTHSPDAIIETAQKRFTSDAEKSYWNSKIDSSEKGAADGLATLGADGKIPATQVPSIAITDVFVVASEAAMLALSNAQSGDVAVRTDLSKSFILNGLYYNLSAWQELLTPGGAATVVSVDGRSGAVTLADLYSPISHVGSGGAQHSIVVNNGSAGFMSGADKKKLDSYDEFLQPSMRKNALVMWLPGTGSIAAINWGVNWTVSATQSHPTITSANLYSSMRRALFRTGTGSGNVSGVRTQVPIVWRGNGPGLGGFNYSARFGFDSGIATAQFFLGLTSSTAALSNQPSTSLNNSVGICKDSTDSSLQLMFRNLTTVTKVDLGIVPAAGGVYELNMWCDQSSSSIFVEVIDLNTGLAVYPATEHTLTLPENTAMLCAQGMVRNTVTGAVYWSLMNMYIESAV